MPNPSPARMHDFEVVSNEEIAEGIFSLVILAPRLASALKPGQFVNIRVPGDASELLRIPLSYVSADVEHGTVEIWYAVVGNATRRMSQWKPGFTSDLLGPGGRGWKAPEGTKRVLVVGGGIGVPPVLCLARELVSAGVAVDACVGAASASKLVGLEDFRALGCDQVCVATDDGSAGACGFCTDPASDLLAAGGYQYVATCGPGVMMSKVAAAAAEAGVYCEASLEAHDELRLRRVQHVQCRDDRRHEGRLHVWSGIRCFQGGGLVSQVNMAVDFGGVKMKNPINTASGTFGQGWQFSELMDVSQLGAITTKGCAAEPWPGNPAPRMTEVRGGMMNSVGLQNPGVSAFAANYGPWLADLTDKGTQVICQVAGHSTEEYVRALKMFDELCPWAAGFEINVSCPNIAAGGAACGSTPEGAAEVMRACRKVCNRPLFVKMAPVRIPRSPVPSRRRVPTASR